ncbi:putative transposon Ty3-I Gag-Pol polyprotein [Rosellinia necatrix]|uniref:Putative transposon Ty3-I Gag-Pol polyprotein n=1 Tax=Rosellinia necatrix TaxID=77044 RepID=A0A1S8A7X9_ROSNE|nr:putative transposon Ty3-I Gag-Pol polyprotein [Rosellinia necatrix]
MSTVDQQLQLLGRQILRFHRTEHPNAEIIEPHDLDNARKVVTSLSEVYDDIPYPVEWAESKTKFRTFLRKWRKQLPNISTTPHKELSRLVIPTAPKFSPPSVGQSPSSRINSGFLDNPEDDTDAAIQKLSNFIFESPHNSPPQSPSMSQPPPPQPLSAEDAATLIAAAFSRQKSDISQIVAHTIQQMQEGTPASSHSGINGNGNLKPEEVGFFNPSSKDYDGSGALSQGKQTIYTDVWAFTDRLRHLAGVHGEAKVNTVWTTCLQATALSWHTTELTDAEKAALRTGTVENICTKLQTRFRRNHSEALHSLQTRRFTLYDLQQGKSIRTFVQSVIRDAKACDYSLRNQLLAAFEALDVEIKSQLDKPNDTTTLGGFLSSIDNRESILVEKARQLPYRRPAPPPQYYGKPNHPPFFLGQNQAQGQGSQAQGHPQGIPQAQLPLPQAPNFPYTQRGANQPYQNPYYRGRGGYRGNYRGRPYYQNNWRNPAINPIGGQGQNANAQRGYPQPYPQPNQQPPPQQFPRNPAQKAYNTWDTEEYDTYDQVWSQWEDTHNLEYVEEQPQDQYPQAQDPILSCGNIPEGFGPPAEGNEDTPEATNFAMITTPSEAQCRRCHQKFPSKNKLHKHISAQHRDVSPVTKAQIEHANVAVSEHVLQMLDRGHVVATPYTRKSQIPIVRSTIDSRPDIGTGFAYKSKTYLQMFIMTSQDTEHEEAICGDTGCTRTLADKSWALAQYPNLHIRHRATPMIIRGIAEDQHETSEYAIIEFLFKGVQDGKPAIASFTREITLVEGLQAKMLLGVDILDAEQIDIILSRKLAVIQSCKVAIPLSVSPGAAGKAKVYVAASVAIPPRSYF